MNPVAGMNANQAILESGQRNYLDNTTHSGIYYKWMKGDIPSVRLAPKIRNVCRT